MKKQMSYLVIGGGSIGRRHIRNLLKLKRKVSVCEPDTYVQKMIRKEFPKVVIYPQLRWAWEFKPDVAVVCTPTSKHVAPAIQAAKQGCHLFIEKPLSHNLSRIKELEALLKRKGLRSLVGCNMRFQYSIKLMTSLVKPLGKIYSIRCAFGQYLPDWRPQADYKKSYSAHKELGGGIVLDAIHELDYLIDIMKKKPTEVSACAIRSSALKIDVEDNAAIVLRFRDGSLGEIHMDYLNRQYHRSCMITAQEGSVYWDEGERLIKVYKAKTKRWVIEKEPKTSHFNQSYVDEFLHLEDCIRLKKETVNPVADAVKLLKVALAAKQSAKKGKHIKIDWWK